jgi:hypothetical protein
MTMLVLQPELARKKTGEQRRGGQRRPEPEETGPGFHLLGFDILLDEDERPVLLELNAYPSLSTQGSSPDPAAAGTEVCRITRKDPAQAESERRRRARGEACAVDKAVKTAVVRGVACILEQEPGTGEQPAAEGAGVGAAEGAGVGLFHELDTRQHPGHARVDALLQRLGRLLQHALRGDNAFGDGLGCARFQRLVWGRPWESGAQKLFLLWGPIHILYTNSLYAIIIGPR